MPKARASKTGIYVMILMLVSSIPYGACFSLWITTGSIPADIEAIFENGLI